VDAACRFLGAALDGSQAGMAICLLVYLWSALILIRLAAAGASRLAGQSVYLGLRHVSQAAAGAMVGLGGFGGGFGGMLIATVTGLRQFTEGYVSSLVTGAFRYLAALLLIQLLVG
jgi:MFS transporter, ACS family, hexuronate transporter